MRAWFDNFCAHTGIKPCNEQYNAQEIVSFVERAFLFDDEILISYEGFTTMNVANSMLFNILSYPDSACLSYSVLHKRMVLIRTYKTSGISKLMISTNPAEFNFNGINTIMVGNDGHDYLLVRNKTEKSMTLEQLIVSNGVKALQYVITKMRPSYALYNCHPVCENIEWFTQDYLEVGDKKVLYYNLTTILQYWNSVQ